eukprot:8160995-Alexandrium_andersonii.AAC.1
MLTTPLVPNLPVAPEPSSAQSLRAILAAISAADLAIRRAPAAIRAVILAKILASMPLLLPQTPPPMLLRLPPLGPLPRTIR